MYKTISDDFIIETISGYKEEMLLIEGKLRILSGVMEDEDGRILEASFPGETGEVRTGPTGCHKDLSDVYRRYLSLIKDQCCDCARYAEELMEKKDSMERVMAAFEILPDLHKGILEVYYKECAGGREKDRVQASVKKFLISERTIRRIKKQAMIRIRTTYESKKTLLDLRLAALDNSIRREATAKTS